MFFCASCPRKPLHVDGDEAHMQWTALRMVFFRTNKPDGEDTYIFHALDELVFQTVKRHKDKFQHVVDISTQAELFRT